MSSNKITKINATTFKATRGSITWTAYYRLEWNNWEVWHENPKRHVTCGGIGLKVLNTTEELMEKIKSFKGLDSLIDTKKMQQSYKEFEKQQSSTTLH